MNRLISVALLLPGLAPAATGLVEQSFQFNAADFVFDKANGYDVVVLPGQYSTSEPGSPNLPLASYQVLIPPDAEVIGLDIKEIETSLLPGEYDVHPSQRPYPLSLPQPGFVTPKAAVYESDAVYPSEPVRFTRSGNLGGHRIAGIQIAPLQYAPARRELRLITGITVNLRYESGRHEVLQLDESQVRMTAAQTRALVRNPGQLAVWGPELRATDDWLCDMIVVTNNSLRGAFQPFVNWKTKQGFKTATVTTESIYATYPGRDNQERIRNCIIDYWRNHGLKWVLVGGDAELVPVRTCRITCEGITENIATDLYYADLQYSWDSDHNNYFGEMTDSVDLFHDLFVGRWCADNAADVALYFAKDTMYAKHPDTSYIRKMVFGSTMLFSPFHGKVINHIIADLFPTGWTFNHLEDPPSGAFKTALDQGNQFGHVAAHGNQTSFSVMSTSECPGLNNGFTRLNFTNSIACQSGWFDGYECLAEGMTRAPNGGSIAVMLNSRYGFGYPPGFGPSEMLDEQFYLDFLLGRAAQFGTLAATSKDFFNSLALNQEVWRWCVYELNLLGDPTLHLWSEKPGALSVTAPGSIPTGPQVCRVRAERLGQPVSGAQVCLMKGSETYARGWTNSQGWIDLLVNAATVGNLDLTVTARDCHVHESQIPVTGSTSAPALVFASCRLVDGNNGRLEPGETADLYVSLTNSGAAGATAVSARLRSFSGYITIVDSLSSFGAIPVGSTVEGDPFRVTAAGNTPEGFRAEFLAACTAGEGNWEPYLSLMVGDEPAVKKLWVDHDVGNMILSVTTLGSIGTLGPYREGSGLKYPRNAGYGNIYFTSLACGNSPNYVVDRWYGRPSSTFQTDWRAVETLHSVTPTAMDQEYRCVISDAAHAAPQGLSVTQWSGCVNEPGYDDFVIMVYTLENQGGSALNGLYCGIFSDFDVNNTQTNSVHTDANRRFVYMSGSSFANASGIKLLYPGVAANLSAILNSQYIQPTNMLSEAVKDSFLRGAIVRASGSSANYSCVASAGPFNLAPGARQRVAFAFVGGTTQAEVLAHADSAQSFHDNRLPVGLTYLRSIIDDAAPGGNGDGVLNPGESINLPVWVANRADHAAMGVWGILRKTSPDTLVTILDSIRYFGSVGAGDSAFTGNDGFKLRVAAACTNGYLLPLVLVCRDTLDSSHVSSPVLRVGSAQLVAAGVLCWDPPPGGNGNGRLDPNEQVQLAVGIGNTGLGNARNVSAVLKSGDARLVVLDSLGAYGDIRHDSLVHNSGDRFEVFASSAIPREAQVSCTLKIRADGYSAIRAFLLSVGMLTTVDPVPDGPRQPSLYYAYDDCDSFYVEAPDFEWIETRGRGTRLTLSDDQTVQINLPTGFGPLRFYGNNYTGLSICGNGWVGLGSVTSTAYSNTALPTSSIAAPAVFANWDDLYPPIGGGVWYFHDTAHHAFVVEWDSVAYYSPQTQWDKFQIVFHDTSRAARNGNNEIKVQYATARNYISSTTGIQDPGSTIAIQVQLNNSYHRAAAPLTAGRAIKYTADSLLTGVEETPGPEQTGPGLSLRVQPNPMRGRALVHCNLPAAGNISLRLYDVAGKLVATPVEGRSAAGNSSFIVHRSHLSAGVYVLKLATETASATTKLIIE